MASPSSIIGDRIGVALPAKARVHLPPGAEGGDLAREASALPGERGGPLFLADQAGRREPRCVGGGHAERMAGVGLVAAGDHERRYVEELELGEALEWGRSRHLPKRSRDRLGMPVLEHALLRKAKDRLAPRGIEVVVYRLHEPVHAAVL